jgi:hypothetical protein
MAITIIVEDGSTVDNANSYVDPLGAFATAYFEAHLYATNWTEATDEQKKAAVVQATRTIDSLLKWKGRRVAQDQPRQWPRYGVRADGFLIESNVVPRRIQEATLEQAMALLERDRLADTAREAPLTELGMGSGAMTLKFGKDPTANLSPIPDIVRQLLDPYGSTSGGGMVRVERA